VLHEAAELELSEYELPPATREAKVDICLSTFLLPQGGQTTLSTALALNTSSSNGSWQVLQTNSKMGIIQPPDGQGLMSTLIQYFDAAAIKRLQSFQKQSGGIIIVPCD
jgi:hypothetical protein